MCAGWGMGDGRDTFHAIGVIPGKGKSAARHIALVATVDWLVWFTFESFLMGSWAGTGGGGGGLRFAHSPYTLMWDVQLHEKMSRYIKWQ